MACAQHGSPQDKYRLYKEELIGQNIWYVYTPRQTKCSRSIHVQDSIGRVGGPIDTKNDLMA
eukprot:12798532-Ditylum_brightwellii.AAC.1